MANYYMIGGDGKEYGPVEAAQLRQWVVDGRANAQTQVRPVEGGAYVVLGVVPELNAAQSASEPQPAAAVPNPAATSYFMRGGDGKEYGPISVVQLRQWVAEGRANSQTLIRAANGGPFIALGMAPGLGAATGARTMSGNLPLAHALAQNSALSETETANLMRRLAGVLADGAGWMKFLAVFSFILSALAIICTYGLALVVCWAPIWGGVVLWSAASTMQQAAFTGSEADIARALDQLRFYFKLTGILRIVMFIGIGVLLLLFIGVIAAGVAAMGNNLR